MIRIDIQMPSSCADCPFIVQIPTMPGAKKIFLCRAGWRQIDAEHILSRREDWCPIVEIDEEEQ